MGRKTDLTDSEKSKIERCLSEGCSTLDIAKVLGRDHRTVKRFVESSRKGRKKRVEAKRRKLTVKDLKKVEREARRKPLLTSAAIFENCDLPGVPKTTRCSVLRDICRAAQDESRASLDKTRNKRKRQGRASDSPETGFSDLSRDSEWTKWMEKTLGIKRSDSDAGEA